MKLECSLALVHRWKDPTIMRELKLESTSGRRFPCDLQCMRHKGQKEAMLLLEFWDELRPHQRHLESKRTRVTHLSHIRDPPKWFHTWQFQLILAKSRRVRVFLTSGLQNFYLEDQVKPCNWLERPRNASGKKVGKRNPSKRRDVDLLAMYAPFSQALSNWSPCLAHSSCPCALTGCCACRVGICTALVSYFLVSTISNLADPAVICSHRSQPLKQSLQPSARSPIAPDPWHQTPLLQLPPESTKEPSLRSKSQSSVSSSTGWAGRELYEKLIKKNAIDPSMLLVFF